MQKLNNENYKMMKKQNDKKFEVLKMIIFVLSQYFDLSFAEFFH